MTFSLHWAGSLLQWITGYPDRGLEMVNEAHALAGRIGHPFNSTFALTGGWREAEGRICSALFWGGEALALGGLGRTGDALALIESAIDHYRNTGDRFMEPEVLRIKAELLLAHDESTFGVAEEILPESIRIASEHKARSWELRSATSLAKLMRSQDRGLQAAICCRRCTNGLPKGSIPPICATPR